MARNIDRWLVSEATRKSKLWHVTETHSDSVVLVVLNTDYDEQLEIVYGSKGQIRFAEYLHWNRETGECVTREMIKTGKRKRVLELINQKDVDE